MHRDRHIPRENLLTLRRLPARLTAEEAACLLGFELWAIPVLVEAGLLTPLGGSAPNGAASFSAADLEARASDRAWLDQATRTVEAHRRPEAGNILPFPLVSRVAGEQAEGA